MSKIRVSEGEDFAIEHCSREFGSQASTVFFVNGETGIVEVTGTLKIDGVDITPSDAALAETLASHGAGQGAALVGMQGSGTVQTAVVAAQSAAGTAQSAATAATTAAAAAAAAASAATSAASAATTAATTAQGTADDAAIVAATAQGTADQAILDAAAAQGAADTAEAHAQTGIANAAAAQSTANTAVSNAATAQATANTNTSAIALRPLISDLASTANGKGASTIGVEDAAGKITATTVEGALAEIVAYCQAISTSTSSILKVVGTQTISNANTVYTDPVFALIDSSPTGQIPVHLIIDGVVRGGYRVDYAGNLKWFANGGDHDFYNAGDNTVVNFRVSSGGDVVAGSTAASLGNSATAGFFQLPVSIGTGIPTGVPASFHGTHAPTFFNTADKKLWINDTTKWLQVPLRKSLSLEERFRMRSADVLGDDFAADFDELTSQTLVDWSVSGGIAVDTTRGPGVWTFPNSNYSLLSKQSIAVENAAVTPWHLGGRMRFGQAIAAGDRMGLFLGTGGYTDFLSIGSYESQSATKFVFSVSKAGVITHVNSTINYDATAFHVFQMWFDGTTVYGQVDNETPVVVAVAANCPTAVAIHPQHGVTISASGSTPVLYLDAVYTATARTAT